MGETPVRKTRLTYRLPERIRASLPYQRLQKGRIMETKERDGLHPVLAYFVIPVGLVLTAIAMAVLAASGGTTAVLEFIAGLFWLGVVVGIVVGWCYLGGHLARERGNNFWGGLVLAFLFGPLGMLITVLIPKDHVELAKREKSVRVELEGIQVPVKVGDLRAVATHNPVAYDDEDREPSYRREL